MYTLEPTKEFRHFDVHQANMRNCIRDCQHFSLLPCLESVQLLFQELDTFLQNTN